MAGTGALPPSQGGAGRTDGSRRKSGRREGRGGRQQQPQPEQPQPSARRSGPSARRRGPRELATGTWGMAGRAAAGAAAAFNSSKRALGRLHLIVSPSWEGVSPVVLLDCGGSRPSILWLLGASRQGWYLPAVSGDLNVTSCMTPKVRSLDGVVVCVLLCVELNPCRLHVVLLS